MYDSDDIRSDSIIHGRMYESTALAMFTRKTGLCTDRAGFFIHPEYPFLGATPDALVGTDSVVEIKCPFTNRDKLVEPGPLFPFLESGPNGPRLKTSHKWYAQVQGQMACSGRAWCYFVAYTFKGLYVQRISFNPEYFINMVPKLSKFYTEHWRPFLMHKITMIQEPDGNDDAAA